MFKQELLDQKKSVEERKRDEIKRRVDALKREISQEKDANKKMQLFLAFAERRDHIYKEIEERLMPEQTLKPKLQTSEEIIEKYGFNLPTSIEDERIRNRMKKNQFKNQRKM